MKQFTLEIKMSGESDLSEFDKKKELIVQKIFLASGIFQVLSVCDISNSGWDDETLKIMLESVSQLGQSITDSILWDVEAIAELETQNNSEVKENG